MDAENVGKVVDVREDEVEIAQLPGAPEVVDAGGRGNRFRPRSAPSFDQPLRHRGLGAEPVCQQPICDPRAAKLILLAKLATGAGADDGDSVFPRGEMLCERGVAAERAEVAGDGRPRFADQLRAGARNEDRRTRDIGELRYRRGAVGEVEPVR
jgi:hypothetical protein